MEDKEFLEYLSKLTCKGCQNRCSLNDPGCGRSRIFIKEAEEKYNTNKNSNKQFKIDF